MKNYNDLSKTCIRISITESLKYYTKSSHVKRILLIRHFGIMEKALSWRLQCFTAVLFFLIRINMLHQEELYILSKLTVEDKSWPYS